jgi:hypothetical protein
MALRDQPYIPLYIQDLMTDEKLNNCCAATHGIYIKGLMCLMHKSEEYGKILLQQKFKQTDKQSKNFAIMLVKHLPYTIDEIEKAIDELIEEKVCYFEDDFICQKRMIKDGALSKVRSKVGKLGGDKTKENNKKLLKKLPKQNMQQITEYENEYESEIINTNSSNNTNGEISKKIALPLKFSEVPNEIKNKNKLFTFSEIITELKLEGTQKNLILAQYKTDSNTLNKYIDFFSVQYTPETETETFSLNEKRIHFKNFLKNNWGKLPQQQEQRPKAKLL